MPSRIGHAQPRNLNQLRLFAHDAFTTEWWVLADRTDILVDLVLHHDSS